MTSKTILLSTFLLLVIVGVIVAATGRSWWRRSAAAAPAPEEAAILPASASEYGKLIRQFRLADSTLEVSGTIRIYDEEKRGDLQETKTFRSFSKGEQYYSQLSYMRTYCDGSLVLAVDSVHRQMTVSKVTPGSGATPGGMALDGLFSDTATFRLSGEIRDVRGERVMSMRNDYQPGIRECRMYYDTMSYRLHRAEIEWWKDRTGRDRTAGRIWLARVDYVYHSPGPEDIAESMRQYIRLGPDGVRPTDAYAGYGIKVNF